MNDEKNVVSSQIIYQGLNHIIKTRELIKNINYEAAEKREKQYAKQYTKGNVTLEKLFLFCFQNKIVLRGFSKGDKTSPAYISFDYQLSNIDFLIKLFSDLHSEGYTFIYMKDKNDNYLFQIECHESKKYLSFFKKIYKSFTSEETTSLPSDLKELEMIIRDDISRSDIQLIYHKIEDRHIYSILTSIPHYINCVKSMHFIIEPLEDNRCACTLISRSRNLSSLKLREIREYMHELNLNYDLMISNISRSKPDFKNISEDAMNQIYQDFITQNKSNNLIIVYQPFTNLNEKEVVLIHRGSKNEKQIKILFEDSEYFEETIIPILISNISKDNLILLDEIYENYELDNNFCLMSNFYQLKSKNENKYIFGNFSYRFIEQIKDKISEERNKSRVPVVMDSSSGFSTPSGLFVGFIILLVSIISFIVVYFYI